MSLIRFAKQIAGRSAVRLSQEHEVRLARKLRRNHKGMRFSKNTRRYLEGSKEYGDDGIRDTPVPIPNTEVKPYNADGTRRATSRETR